MNAQQEAVAAWRYLESRQIRPSTRRVATMLRVMGLRVDDHYIRDWLRPFWAKTAVHRIPTAPRTDAPTARDSGPSTAASEHDPPHSEEEYPPQPAPQSPPQIHPRYAREKEVSLVPKVPRRCINTTPRDDGLFAVAEKPTNGNERGSPKQTTLPLSRETDLRVWALLDTAWAYLREAVPGLAMTRTQWRQRNAIAARDLIAAGKTREQVLEMLQVAHEHPGATYYRGLVMLARLAERWHVLESIADRPRERERVYQVL